MVCGLEIPLAILGAITACTTLMTTISEGLPFIKKYSGNGIIHGIYHLIHPDKCIEPTMTSSDSLSSLGEEEA
tara:strand:+ start:455 stop:673 length:219 start_codon:yes stop_codon:yes gene_type:complete